jgi:hypothetical protein
MKMASLPDAPVYEKFAYHVALLKQFVVDVEAGIAANQRLPTRSSSMVQAPSSVHGSSLFASFRKDKKADPTLRRAISSDGLNLMNRDSTAPSL